MFLRLILGAILIFNDSILCWANEDGLVFNDVINEDPELNANYFRGPFLVFDCEEAHYVCTGPSEFNYCKKNRQDKLLNPESKHLGCVPIQKYADNSTCYKTQLDLMSSSWAMLNCTHPQKRKRPYWP